MTLSDFTRYVGTVVSVSGLVVAAPHALRQLRDSLTAWMSSGFRIARRWTADRIDWVRRFLSRWFPSLGRDINVQLVDSGGVSDSLSAVGNPTVRIWSPEAPVDERIELLHQYVEELQRRVGDVEGRLESLWAESASGDQALWSETAALRQLQEERERRSTTLDARGLPIAAMGIAFCAIPQEVAALPFHLGIVANIVALMVTTAVVLVTWQEHHRTRSAGPARSS